MLAVANHDFWPPSPNPPHNYHHRVLYIIRAIVLAVNNGYHGIVPVYCFSGRPGVPCAGLYIFYLTIRIRMIRKLMRFTVRVRFCSVCLFFFVFFSPNIVFYFDLRVQRFLEKKKKIKILASLFKYYFCTDRFDLNFLRQPFLTLRQSDKILCD